jgi:AcrR family transcriptional regulator
MSDGVCRREQILRAAEKLLRRYGASKTTMADLAREAGIAVGSMYLEFASKEAIVEALSSARHERVLEAMRKAAAGDGPFANRLTAIFDARTTVLLRFADEGAHACELVHCLNAAVLAAHTRFEEEETALLTELLREGAKAGVFAAAKPAITARTVLRAYAVFAPPGLFELPRDQVQDALGAMHQLVVHGVLVR